MKKILKFNLLALAILFVISILEIVGVNVSGIIGSVVSLVVICMVGYSVIKTISIASKKDDVLFAKCKIGGVIPSKNEEDAGYDIYPCIDDDVVIMPNETVMIPTGICSAFDDKYVFILKERGSTGTKGMGQRAGIIDSGFRGEWKVPVTNHNNMPLIISCGKNDNILNKDGNIIYPQNKAICQALLFDVPKVNIKQISSEDLKSIPSKRGDGMLGSSGK